MGEPPAIEASGLGWTYEGRSSPALDGIDFLLGGGRLLLVLGPSGSGKSTLARAIAGLVPHVLPGQWRGSLRIGDAQIAATPARLLGELVGLVFQDPDSQLVMSRVDDEVTFGLENRGWSLDQMRAAVPAALSQVGLAGFEPRATNSLSGGEKQRLAVADVLAARPSVLVLDEPTANLDPPGMRDTIDRLAELAASRRHTVVLIEHRLEAVLPLADDVLLIDERGRQLAFGPADGIGREAVDLLDRSGAWVPASWRSRGGRGARGSQAGRGGQAGLRPQAADQWATDSPTLLEASGLRVEYPADESGSRLALDGVSLRLAAGERIALVGPNGAGKSTLLLTLAGLLPPVRGSVGLRALPDDDGAEDMRDPRHLRSSEIASRIGLVFQDPELGFVARTARDEVEATSQAGTSRRDRAASARDRAAEPAFPGAEAVLAHFGLADHVADDPFQLSQGEQRRLSLAALALDPPAVLLLDEPTYGLDRRGTEAVVALLDGQRSAGQAQVLATHDPRLLPFCDRVVALDCGCVVFDGPVAAFLAAPPYEPKDPWRAGAFASALDTAAGGTRR